MLNRFYTLEFFREIARILNPGGVVITEITSSLHLQTDAVNYTGSVYKTLRAVFPYVLVTPGATHTYFAAADPDSITFDVQTLSRRYRERQIASDYFLNITSRLSFNRNKLRLSTPRCNKDSIPFG
jgi:spermidine synthase